MLTSSRMQAGVRARAATRNDWPLGETSDPAPFGLEHRRKRVAHQLVIVDHEDFAAVEVLLSHASFAPFQRPCKYA